MEVGSFGVNGVYVLRSVVLGYSIVLGVVLGFVWYMVVKSVLGLLDRLGDVIFIIVLVSNGLGKIDYCFLFGYMLLVIGGNVLVINFVWLLMYNKCGYF